MIIRNNNNDYNLVRELKNLWNMKVMVIPILIGALGMVPKSLVRELEEFEIGGRTKTIKTTALLRSAGILRRALVTWGDLLSLGLLWKTIS